MQRTLRLLEAVGEHLRGATAEQLALAAGLPLGTTHHLLRTLTREGCLRRADGPVVEHQEHRQYNLGAGCAAVPGTVGSTMATMAISLPVEQAVRLRTAAGHLRLRVGAMSPSFVP